MSQELITVEQDRFMPALTVQQAIDRRKMLVELTRSLMVKDVDFGTIPGTPKPTLLKPGAEKLCTQFGLTPTFELVDSVKDWNGAGHGEPLFYFEYKCRLWRNGMQVGEGDGSCNSWEKKYRYRDRQRVCPQCGQATIFKSKPRQGDPPNQPQGYYCWAKKGGCGTQFSAGDTAIEEQETGQIANPDIFDQINTIKKMAQKRSLIAATLIATNASEFYTQDLDELHDDMQPIGTQAAPVVDTATTDSLRAMLAAARDRLRTLGGEPRPLTKKQVEGMDAHSLTLELAVTNETLWELAISRMASNQPHGMEEVDLPLFPDDDPTMAELDAAVDAAIAQSQK